MKPTPESDAMAREAMKTLEPLRVSPVTTPTAQHARSTRAALLPAVEAMIEEVPQRRESLRRRRLAQRAGRGAVATMAAAVAIALVWPERAEAPQDEVGGAAPLQLVVARGRVAEDGRPLAPGSRHAIDELGRLSTPDTHGAEVSAGGARLAFDPGSTADLSFTRTMRRVVLNRGKVELDVAPLEKGTTLSVATRDAVVTVHGTRFSVEYTAEDEDTCVVVHEGVVSVLRGASRERLTAGERSGCQARRAPQDEPAATESKRKATADKPPAPPPRRLRKSRASPKRKAPSGTLTEENALFRRALAAEQARDLARAEAQLERLLERYPSSPLAGEARRVLQRVRDAGRPAVERDDNVPSASSP